MDIDWRMQPDRSMVEIMIRRLLRPLVYALVIAQALLSAPVMSAASESAGASAGMPCHGDMAPSAGDEHCPCCPDGIDSFLGCLAACAGATATPSVFVMPVSAQRVERARSLAVLVNGDPADPPLKPPPIL